MAITDGPDATPNAKALSTAKQTHSASITGMNPAGERLRPCP
jgi:hypothetical protein